MSGIAYFGQKILGVIGWGYFDHSFDFISKRTNVKILVTWSNIFKITITIGAQNNNNTREYQNFEQCYAYALLLN